MQRLWKKVAARTAPSSVEAPLRILELNCLTHWSAEGESAEEFAVRTNKHVSFITSCKPTIAVLVEVDGSRTLPPGTRSLAQTLLEAAGEGGFDGVSAAKGNEHGDETWILFDPRRVKLLATHTLTFAGTESQFALFAHVHVSCVGELLVIGQHAKAGRTEKNEDIRMRHTDVLREFLHSLSCSSSSSTDAAVGEKETDRHYSRRRWGELLREGRVIWAGDFNAGPHSYGGLFPARWFVQSVVGGMAKAFGFTSAYASANLAEEVEVQPHAAPTETEFQHDEHPFTTFKYRDGRLIQQCIDYIFFQPKGLALTQLLTLPTAESMPVEGLPSAEWASDHLALVCDFCCVAQPPQQPANE